VGDCDKKPNWKIIDNILPLIHRDPFDGIIVATAIAENRIIVTADEEIQKYDVSWIW